MIDIDKEIAELDAAAHETQRLIREMKDELLRLEGAKKFAMKLAAQAQAETPPPSGPGMLIDPTEDDDGVTGPPGVLVGAGANGAQAH